MNNELNYNKLRKMIANCVWTFAKTMPFAPHEYIVKHKCTLTAEEFEYFITIQREYGVKERWGKYNNLYLYIDDYKYWTMGAPIEETTVINRTKVSVVNDVHLLYKGINDKESTMSYIDEYIHKQMGLKTNDKEFNIELINGRLKEIFDCICHLERIRNNYVCDIMKEWSENLSADYPDFIKVDNINPNNNIYTGVSLPFGGIHDGIAVRIQMENRKLYYGITYMPQTKDRRVELQEALSFINNNSDFIKGNDWLYYKYTSFRDGYVELKKLIKKLKRCY